MTRNKEAAVPNSFPITVDVSEQIIRDTLCAAFEGGSNYWYTFQGIKYGRGYSKKDFEMGGRLNNDKIAFHPAMLAPLYPGCEVILGVHGEEGIHSLDAGKIERGLYLMATKYPKMFGNLLDNNADADAADVFLQLCVFGEVLYG